MEKSFLRKATATAWEGLHVEITDLPVSGADQLLLMIKNSPQPLVLAAPGMVWRPSLSKVKIKIGLLLLTGAKGLAFGISSISRTEPNIYTYFPINKIISQNSGRLSCVSQVQIDRQGNCNMCDD